MRSALIVFILLCAVAYAYAQPVDPVSITAKIEPATATIGQKIELTLRITCADTIDIHVPVVGEKLGDFTVGSSGSRSRVWFGRKTVTARYTLTTFTIGTAVIPKLTVEYQRRGDTQRHTYDIEEKKIQVTSLLEKAGKDAALRDIKGPVGLWPQFHLYLLLAALALAASAVVAAFIIAARTRKARRALEAIPAHILAYRQLEELKAKNLVAQGKLKAFFIELSGIVRYYLENRFHLKAPEMTTEEFFFSVKDSAALAGEHQAVLKEFLVCCDLVKFAKYSPQSREIENALETAQRFIDQTKEESPAGVSQTPSGMKNV